MLRLEPGDEALALFVLPSRRKRRKACILCRSRRTALAPSAPSRCTSGSLCDLQQRALAVQHAPDQSDRAAHSAPDRGGRRRSSISSAAARGSATGGAVAAASRSPNRSGASSIAPHDVSRRDVRARSAAALRGESRRDRRRLQARCDAAASEQAQSAAPAARGVARRSRDRVSARVMIGGDQERPRALRSRRQPRHVVEPQASCAAARR